MILVFLFSCLIIIFTMPLGFFFTSENNLNLYSYSKATIFGVIFVSFIALLINFFLPLNIYISTLIPIISLSIIIIFYKKFINIIFLKLILIKSILITILLLESNVYRPDAGLYHLPFTGILNIEKIIFGISNLHFRYAHTSILQYFSAINNNLIFQNNGIVFAQALIAASIIVNFLSLLNHYLKKNNFNFHFYFLLFIILYISYKMNRYSEYGNDAPSHFLLFFLVSEFLILKNRNNYLEHINKLILSLFIVQNKLTLIFIILLNFFNFKKNNFYKLVTNRRFIFLSTFFSLWILKNIFSSGCALYPITVTCLESLPWVDLDSVKNISISSEAWTKGWSNLENNNSVDIQKFIKELNWINSWSSVHLKVIIEIISPYLLFSILLIIALSFKSKKNNVKIDKIFYLYFIIIVICCITWFIKAPLYRYGYSFLISLIAFTFSFIAVKVDYNKNYHNKIMSFLLILSISIIFIKNIVRINNSPNDYNNYPWPKFYSMDEKNIQTEFYSKKINDLEIIYPKKGYCMYIKKICSHYKLDENLKIRYLKNYILIEK